MNGTTEIRVSPLDRLVVLRGVLKDPVVGALRDLLSTSSRDDVARTRAYAELAFQVFAAGDVSLRERVLAAVLDDNNVYSDMLAEDEEPGRMLRMAVECDLRNIQAACAGTIEELKGEVSEPHMLPAFDMGQEINFVVAYHRGGVEEMGDSEEEPTQVTDGEAAGEVAPERESETEAEPAAETDASVEPETQDAVESEPEVEAEDKSEGKRINISVPAPVVDAGKRIANANTTKRLVHWLKN